MKFWKINEKALRCILNFDDLKEQNIRLEDMVLGTDSAKEFLNEIIIQACMELNMDLGSQKLSVHVMPLPGERIDLLISELDEASMKKYEALQNTPEKEETLFMEESPAVIPELMNKKLLFAVYRFSSLQPIEQLSKRIYKDFNKESSLFKEPVSGTYYLTIQEKRKKFQKLADIASEYGILCSMDPLRQSSLKEHCEVIIKKHAIEHLAKL